MKIALRKKSWINKIEITVKADFLDIILQNTVRCHFHTPFQAFLFESVQAVNFVCKISLSELKLSFLLSIISIIWKNEQNIQYFTL